MDPRHAAVAAAGTGGVGSYWSRGAEELLHALQATPQGLTAREAARRARIHGPNAVADVDDAGIGALVWRQLSSPLVLILMFAAVVSLALRDWLDSALVLVIVLGSAALGFVQEYRASVAVRQLRARLALRATVRRDGGVHKLPARSLVPGDIVVLAAGNLVSADAVVLQTRDFLVTEASLTGESFPVEKHPGVVDAGAPLAARTNCVFLGTSVRSGTAEVLIVATGRRTQLGAIASQLGERRPESAFARGLRAFGWTLFKLMFVMVLAVLTLHAMFERPLLESLMFAIALAVGMSPELLPAIVTVTMSKGARAMAHRGVLVRRLEAIENLGGIDILCSDKTGTLTEGTMTLHAALDALGHESAEVRRLGCLNALFETGIENPLDGALVTAAHEHGVATTGWNKVDEIPYDFVRKRLTIVVASHGDPAQCEFISKGAFDTVLSVCTSVAESGAAVALDARRRAELLALYERLGRDGLRAIAVATRRVAARGVFERDDEREMCFVGLLVFADPPRADIGQTIRQLADLGIALKIISGDNRYVNAHLARHVGLDPEAMLTGAEVTALRDEALWQRAERTQLFVEVDPQQKERIVRALQRTGHSVGYLGDGINDVPALHAADIGISVDGAVDVARESADVVLLRHDLRVLHDGVIEGRRSFANTLKYIAITTSANFGNMVSMSIASVFLPFQPLAAKQILLNNLLSDVPSMAISTDHVDAQALRQPQRWQLRDVRNFMLHFGALSTVFDLLTFALLLLVFAADAATFQSAWFVVSLLTELVVVLVLRTAGPAWRSAPSHLLWLSTLAVAALALASPYLGPLARAFGFVPLPLPLLATLVLVVVAYIGATELAKRMQAHARGAG